jgi:DNA-directed RNA polymerase sigma subunit (sigma70/sigma32)
LTLSKEEMIARSREIYRLRTEEKLSLQTIGDQYGLSRERVRQIIAKHERVYLRREQLEQGKLRLL